MDSTSFKVRNRKRVFITAGGQTKNQVDRPLESVRCGVIWSGKSGSEQERGEATAGSTVSTTQHHNTTEWLAKQTRGAFGMFASSSLLAEGLDRCRSGRSAGPGHR